MPSHYINQTKRANSVKRQSFTSSNLNLFASSWKYKYQNFVDQALFPTAKPRPLSQINQQIHHPSTFLKEKKLESELSGRIETYP